MSIVLITPGGHKGIKKVIGHLRKQTVSDLLEVIVVAPSESQSEIESALRDTFRWFQFVRGGAVTSSAKDRAAGVLVATAPLVTLIEDHSLPEADWAAALIAAHRGPWAAVGPAIVNGNPDSVVSWANILVEYSHWLHPAEPGPVEHLPGHNSSYKRDVLLSYRPRLADMLEAESILHWDLRSKGYQLYQEPAARTNHWNFSSLASSIPLRFNAGRAFAASRAKNEAWSPLRRLFYAVNSPFIPAIRLRRIIRELHRPGRPAHLIPRVRLALLAALIIDGAGEMVGYAVGRGNAEARLYDMEFHRDRFLSAKDRHAFRAD